MPTNTNILMIRHGEKPATGPLLAVAGQQRAEAYQIYFQNYTLNSTLLKFTYLFAAADSTDSQRPRLTLEPTAAALNLTIDVKHKDKDYQKLVDDLIQNSKYNGADVLVCWHHEEILAFAYALGVVPSDLSSSPTWPNNWPGNVYGWVLQICFDSSGAIDTNNTVCLNEQLMYGDYGVNPPLIQEAS